MQTSHTTASAAATTPLARRIVAASWKPVLFAVLMWLSAAAGEIPIPGTPVPITLQTFVVMLAGLMLPWRQAGAAVATYLAAAKDEVSDLPRSRAMTTTPGRKPKRKPALGPTRASVEVPPANTGRPTAPAAR